MSISLSIRLGLGSNTGVSVLGSAQVGNVLSLSALFLEGQSPMDYSVQWRRDAGNIPGATSATYTVATADSGASIDAIVTLPDGSTLTSSNSVSIPVSGIFLSGSPLPATFGQAYSWVPNVVGGTAPYTFSVSTGSLPSGLSLNTSTGEISGTPTTSAGASVFTLSVSDALSATSAASVTLNVRSVAPAAPVSGDIILAPVDSRPDQFIIRLDNLVSSTGGLSLTAARVQILYGGQFTAPVLFGEVDASDNIIAPLADTDYVIVVPQTTVGGTAHFGATVTVQVWHTNAGLGTDYTDLNVTSKTLSLAPILSAVADVASTTDDTAATVTVTTSGDAGTLWFARSASVLADGAAVKAAGGAVSQAVTSAGAKALSVTGLTASTTYNPYYVAHEIATGIFSAVSVGDGFTTIATPTPVIASFTTEASIVPATGPAGSTFYVSDGVITGTPAPTVTRTLTLAAGDVASDMVDLAPGVRVYTPQSTGSLALGVSATNGSGTDTSSDTSTVAARDAYQPLLWGANVAGPSKTSQAAPDTVIPFANVFKGARRFVRNVSTAPGVVVSTSNLDATGYPKDGASASTAHSAKFLDVPPLHAGKAPFTGTFHILWRGDSACTVQIDGSAVTQVDTVTLADPNVPGAISRTYRHATVSLAQLSGGHTVRPIIPAAVSLTFDDTTNTDWNVGYVRDMHLVHADNWTAYQAGSQFSQAYLDETSWIRGAVRFLNWTDPNRIGHNPDYTIYNRSATIAVAPADWTYNPLNGIANSANQIYGYSVPIEAVVNFMNELYDYQDANGLGSYGYPVPWINYPIQMTDAEITRWAQYVRDNLNPAKCPNTSVLVESGNEKWNSAGGFDCYQVCAKYGSIKYAGSGGNATQKAAYWASFRAASIYDTISRALAYTGLPTFVMPSWSTDKNFRENLEAAAVQAPASSQPGSSDPWVDNTVARNASGTIVKVQEQTTCLETSCYVAGTMQDKRPDARIAAVCFSSGVFGSTAAGIRSAAHALARLITFGSISPRTYTLTRASVTSGMVLDNDTAIDVTQLFINGGNGNDGANVFDLVKVLSANGILSGTATYADLHSAANTLLRIINGTDLQYRTTATGSWTTAATFAQATPLTISDLLKNFHLAVTARRRTDIQADGSSVTRWYPIGYQTAYSTVQQRMPQAKWAKDTHNGSFANQWTLAAYECGYSMNDNPTTYFDQVVDEFLYGPDNLSGMVWERCIAPAMLANDLEMINYYKTHNQGATTYWGITDVGRDPDKSRLAYFKAAAQAYPLPVAYAVTLNDLSRDLVVFDSGAAFGLNAASVPISGTATAGAVVQARVLRASDDSQYLGWVTVATADGSGNWSGSRDSIPRTSDALYIQVRLQASTGTTATMTNTFFSGHVIDVWGQSELHRSVMTGFPGVSPAPTITDPLALQVSWPNDQTAYGTDLRHDFVDSGNANLAGKLGQLANMLTAERPGERFHLVMHTLSATGVRAALDDAMTPRQWSEEVTIRDFALADGQHPGLAVQSWYNADASGFEGAAGTIWMTAISGLNANGTAHTRGTAAPAGGFDFDHYFSDWYDYARTKWAMAGPHRFETTGFDGPIEANRYGMNAIFSNSIMSSRAVRVIEPLAYQNDPTDPIHPGTTDPDGMSRFMALIGYGILEGLDIGFATPVLDQWSYNGTTDVLTIGSSAGAITTTRIARGGTRPGGRPIIDQIFKNRVLVPAADLSISGGDILVANVVDGDVVSVGVGGIGTGAIGAEDIPGALSDETWQDWPIVNVGQAYSGIEGLPVRGRAVCPAGVVPAATIGADPNGNPNRLASAVTNFTFTGSNASSGWYTNTDSQWVFGTPANGMSSDAVFTSKVAIARSKGINTGGVISGFNLELSFELTTEDDAHGDLRIQVRSATGSATNIFAPTDVAVTYGARNTIAMTAAFPAGSADVDIYIQRVSGSVGTAMIKNITLKQV